MRYIWLSSCYEIGNENRLSRLRACVINSTFSLVVILSCRASVILSEEVEFDYI